MNKPEISFEEFLNLTGQLDIRYGTITEVEIVEKSKKLYKLTVDFGEEIGKKTILSALREYITGENLLYEQYPFILNMPPREMMGITSEGMIILPNSEDGKPLFNNTNGYPNGTTLF